MDLATLALVTLLAQPDCATLEKLPSSHPPTKKQIPIIETVEADILMPFPNKQTIVHMDQEKGESQLRRLSLLSIVEEFWVYVPRTETWYDVGYNNKPGFVQIDTPKMFNLLRNEPGAITYHHHPAVVEEGTPYTHPFQALPSFDDLIGVIADGTYVGILHPNHPLKDKIISPLGITELQLTPLGVSCFRKNLNKIEAYAKFIESQYTSEMSFEEGLQIANTPFVKVTFHPY